jgi:glycosyltransferase involved in cell wall biosynthesis
MRIVVVTDGLGAAYGQERVVGQSAELLLEAGHEVHFVAGALREPLPRRTSHLELPGLFQAQWLTPKKEIAAFTERLARYFETARPDLVHFVEVPEPRVTEWIAGRYPTLATAHLVSLSCPASHRLIRGGGTCEKKSGWACLVHHHGYGCLGFLKSDLHRAHAVRNYLLKRKALRRTPVAAVSESVKRILVRDGWDEKNVLLVPNPVSVPSVTPFEKAPPGLVLAASRLTPLKGIDRLIAAFAGVKSPSELWICGDGSERQSLERLIGEKSLGARVKLLGARPHEEVLRLCAAADVVVQPNLGPETFGMTVAEASALGRAVLASDVPGLNEVLSRRETALLVPPGDVAALTAALDELLSKPELRERLGRAGRERMAARYSPKTHLEAQLAAYRAAISSS